MDMKRIKEPCERSHEGMAHLPRADEGHAAENGLVPNDRRAELVCQSFENTRIIFKCLYKPGTL